MIFVVIDSKRRRLTLGASSLGLLTIGILLVALA